MRRALAVLAALLYAIPAIGATDAPSSSHGNNRTFELCNDESSTGVCDNSDGNGNSGRGKGSKGNNGHGNGSEGSSPGKGSGANDDE